MYDHMPLPDPGYILRASQSSVEGHSRPSLADVTADQIHDLLCNPWTPKGYCDDGIEMAHQRLCTLRDSAAAARRGTLTSGHLLELHAAASGLRSWNHYLAAAKTRRFCVTRDRMWFRSQHEQDLLTTAKQAELREALFVDHDTYPTIMHILMNTGPCADLALGANSDRPHLADRDTALILAASVMFSINSTYGPSIVSLRAHAESICDAMTPEGAAMLVCAATTQSAMVFPRHNPDTAVRDISNPLYRLHEAATRNQWLIQDADIATAIAEEFSIAHALNPALHQWLCDTYSVRRIAGSNELLGKQVMRRVCHRGSAQ